jgi:glycosyltransferase involved in cell wall biosynthesis
MSVSLRETASSVASATFLQTKRVVVMLGPSMEAKGGMASVAQNWFAAGFFTRWRVTYVATYRDAGKLAKAYVALLAILRFARMLLRGRVALVHVHVASRMSLWRKAWFIWLAYLARVPVVLHIHGGDFMAFYEQCNAPQRWVIRWLASRARRVVVLSEAWRAQIGRICSPSRVVVVPNFVNFAPIGPAASKNPHQLLFLGLLIAAKGLRELFQALALLRREFPALRLICAGDGDYEQVRAWLCEFNVSDLVELPGWVGPARKQELLQSSALFVLPSHAEAMPISLLEAMAAGLGAIATRVGSVAEVVDDGVDGLLIEPHNVAALVAACRRLLVDSSLTSRLGQQARDKVTTQFSPQRCLQLMDNVYKEILKAN